MSETILSDGLTERMQVTGLLAYPHLTHPNPLYRTPRYAAVLVPPISALFDIEAAIGRVALAAWSPNVEFHSSLKFSDRVRGGNWCVSATSVTVPNCRDETGMPERPDMFYSGQTVEMDLVFYAAQFTITPRGAVQRAVGAELKGIKFLGGFVRSTE